MRLTPPFSRSKTLLPLVASSALLACASAQAANVTFVWNGVGVGSNTGSYWDATGNYTGASNFGSTTDLNFAGINATGAVNLTSTTVGSVSAGSIYFATGTSTNTNPVFINLHGTGTPGQTILNLAGNIYMPSPAGSVVKFGDDLTVNLSNAAHSVQFTQNTSVNVAVTALPVVVLSSKLTGGGASAYVQNVSAAMGLTTVSGTPTNLYATPMVLVNNDTNDFDGGWRIGGLFSYTSINNAGAGAGTSSLGRAVASSGSISLAGGGFSYVGSGDQFSNRPIYFASNSSSINNFASTASTLTLTGALNSTNTVAATLSLNASEGNTLVIQDGIENSAYAVSLTKAGGVAYVDANGILRGANGYGTVILAGANTYTGTTTVSGGTLQIGTGGAASTGNLINSGGTYSALTFNGSGGTFRVTEASGVSQQMGALNFGGGDGVIESVNNGGTGLLSFTSLTSGTGATGNFIVTNGVNGTTNAIVLTGQSGVLGARYFFGGSTYAYADTSSGTPYARAINYGIDAGTQNNTTGAQFTADSNVKVSSTDVSGLTTVSIKTLEIADARSLTIGTNQTLTTGGILKSGGGTATITGGTIALTTNELVVRTDGEDDFLTIGSRINVSWGFTKSGDGTVRLTNTGNVFGRSTYLNGGWLQVVNGALPNGYVVYFNGGNLEFLGATGMSNFVNPNLTFNNSGTIKSDLGTIWLSGPLTLNGNTATFSGGGNILETGTIAGTGGSIAKTGSGTLYIGGINTYTGATVVKEGKLQVDYTVSATSTASSVSNFVNVGSNLDLQGGELAIKGRANGLAVSGGGTWTATLGKAVLTFSGGVPSGLVVGQSVSGTGIPAGSYILSIIGNAVTISGNVTTTSGSDLTGVANTSTTSQTFANTFVTAGNSTVSVDANSGSGTVLNLNAITRRTGASVNFVLPSGAQGSSNGIFTNTVNGSNGILGGYATVGGSSWAVSGAAGTTAGNITALSSYGTDYASAGSATNFDATASGAFTNTAVNSMRFNTAAPVAVSLNGATTVSSGGILVSAAVGANASSISGGTSLTSGNGTDLIVHQNNAAGAFTIGTKITGAIGLTKSGVGELILAGDNDYTGGTYINGGKVTLLGTMRGSSLNMVTGSMLDVYGTLEAGNAGQLSPVVFTLEGTASIAFHEGSTLLLNLGNAGAASTVSFSTLGDWLTGSGNATLALGGDIDYSATYKVFSNVDTLFGFANVVNYDTSRYQAQVSLVGNDEVLTFAVVPEPGTWAMLVGGMGMLLAGQRARRRNG